MSPTTTAFPQVAKVSVTTSSSTAARLALTAAGLFVLVLAVLHVLRPDLDPSWNVISVYALGESGWMMTLAFASLGIACASLVAALWSQTRSKLGRVGLGLLAVSAVGFALAAVFPTDPITATAAEATTRGHLHSAGGMLGGLLPFAAVLVAWGLSRSPVWRPIRRSLWWATALVWVGDAVFIASMAALVPADGRLGPGVAIGWPNRLLIATYCVWLMVVAWRATALSRARTP